MFFFASAFAQRLKYASARPRRPHLSRHAPDMVTKCSSLKRKNQVSNKARNHRPVFGQLEPRADKSYLRETSVSQAPDSDTRKKHNRRHMIGC